MEVPLARGRPKAALGLSPGAARPTGKHGQFPFASGGTGDSGADRFAERGGKDEPTNCPAIGTDQRDRGQMAATFPGARRGGAGLRVWPRHSPTDQDDRVAQLVRKTLETKPRDGTRWSVRQIAGQTRPSK